MTNPPDEQGTAPTNDERVQARWERRGRTVRLALVVAEQQPRLRVALPPASGPGLVVL